MVEMAFDTMAAVRRLRETGLDAGQAEAITATVCDGVTGGVATKSDLSRVESELKSDILAVKSELKSDILAVKSELKSDILAVNSDILAVKLELKSDISRLDSELKWIKIIGGTILVMLVLPWLVDLISPLFPK